MKRAGFLYSLALLLLTANGVALGQSDAKSNPTKVCPFEISGMWRSDATTISTPIFFSFSPEGHVTLFSHSADTLAKDFEVLTSVSYKLDTPAAPRRIEFFASRGNDIFARGTTSLKIVEYGDDSFTTLDPASERQTKWIRERTHRYFLTFAARSRSQQGGPAFAMWTTLDGGEPTVEALGIQITKDDAGKTVPVFGPIPAEVYDQVTEVVQKDKKTKDEIVIVRFEMTQAEFLKTRETYHLWDKYVKSKTLPEGDPYLNVMEFLRQTAGGLIQCGEKNRLHNPTRGERDELVARHAPQQRPLEFIRIMRNQNEELNVTGATFPWSWRPMLKVPVQ